MWPYLRGDSRYHDENDNNHGKKPIWLAMESCRSVHILSS